MRRLILIALLAGCTDDPTFRERPDPTETGVTSSTTTTTTTTTTSTTTGSFSTTTEVDCSTIPEFPLSVTELNIETTEDFDFDGEGRLVFAEWLGSTLIGVDIYNDFEIISAGIQDTRGISVLADGRIIIAYISFGTVGIIDPATGANDTLIAGLSGPNALEVGQGNTIYFTETGNGSVREFDYVTLESKPVAGGFNYPNGLVINERHDILYVSDSSDGIWAVPKNPDGTWGDKYLVYDPAGFGSYDGMEVDSCGNLYVLGFSSGEVARMDPEASPVEGEIIFTLSDPQAFLWNAMHWGSGRGGWKRDTLYVTDRNKVFAVEMGVPGKAQPVDALP